MPDVLFEGDDPYDYVWTLAAFEAIQAGTLKRSLVPVGLVLLAKVVGPCPRCHHPLDWSMPVDATTGAGGVLGGDRQTVAPRIIPVDVTCGCPERHAGAPKNVTGCGIGFRVELKEGRDV